MEKQVAQLNMPSPSAPPRPLIISPRSRRMSTPPGWKVTNRRNCTDVLFALMLLSMWGAMTCFGVNAIKNGNLRLLVSPMDHEGNICGYNGLGEYLYPVNTQLAGVCVDECPETTDTSQYICIKGVQGSEEEIKKGRCMHVYASTSALRRCIITDVYMAGTFNPSDFSNLRTFVIQDLFLSKFFILGFDLGVAFVLSVVIVRFMCVPGVLYGLFWLSNLAVIASLIASGYGLGSFAHEMDEQEQQFRHAWLINTVSFVSYGCYIAGFVWACYLTFCQKQIDQAIGIMNQASQAMTSFSFLTTGWPLLKIVGLGTFFAVWMVYVVFTASMGDVQTVVLGDLHFKVFAYKDEISQRFWFFLFCMFWTLCFIAALGDLVVSNTISTWYFSRDKAYMGNSTFFSCMTNVCIFNCGTAAFGGITIIPISWVRTLISYFRGGAKNTSNTASGGLFFTPKCTTALFSLNKNAYIMTSINGTDLFESSQVASDLLLRNPDTLSTISTISDFVLIFVRILIVLTCGVAVHFTIGATIGGEVVNSFVPTVATMLIASLIASSFVDVYSVTSSTLAFCSILDKELHAPAMRYAEAGLRTYIERNSICITSGGPLIIAEEARLVNGSINPSYQ